MKGNRTGSARIMALAALSLIDYKERVGEPVFEKEPIPDYLDVENTPQEVCQRYDIFLNGVQVRGCAIVDVKLKRIVQFKHLVGNLPVKSRLGKYETRVLTGDVQIRRKHDKTRDNAVNSKGTPEASSVRDEVGGNPKAV